MCKTAASDNEHAMLCRFERFGETETDSRQTQRLFGFAVLHCIGKFRINPAIGRYLRHTAQLRCNLLKTLGLTVTPCKVDRTDGNHNSKNADFS